MKVCKSKLTVSKFLDCGGSSPEPSVRFWILCGVCDLVSLGAVSASLGVASWGICCLHSASSTEFVSGSHLTLLFSSMGLNLFLRATLTGLPDSESEEKPSFTTVSEVALLGFCLRFTLLLPIIFCLKCTRKLTSVNF